MRLECLNKIALVVIPKLLTDLTDRRVRSVQQFLGPFHLQLGYIFDKSSAGFLLKQPAEIAGIQVQVIRHLIRVSILEPRRRETYWQASITSARLLAPAPAPLARAMDFR